MRGHISKSLVKECVMTALQIIKLSHNFIVEARVSCGFAVNKQLIVLHADGVTGYADDAFYQQRLIVGRIEGNDFSRLRAVPFCEVPTGEGHLEVVGYLVNDDAVSFENGRFH